MSKLLLQTQSIQPLSQAQSSQPLSQIQISKLLFQMRCSHHCCNCKAVSRCCKCKLANKPVNYYACLNNKSSHSVKCPRNHCYSPPQQHSKHTSEGQWWIMLLYILISYRLTLWLKTGTLVVHPISMNLWNCLRMWKNVTGSDLILLKSTGNLHITLSDTKIEGS